MINNGFFIFSFFIFAFGACIGSFLNVCIWRIPRGESLFFPPSTCPKCGHKIRFYENIPVLSWIFLRGKCSSCSKEISVRYPSVELLCATLYLFIWLKIYFSYQEPLRLLPIFAVAALAITTFFIDIEHYIIPDLTTYPVIFFALSLSLFFPEAYGFKKNPDAFIFSFTGFVISVSFMAFFSLLGKKIFKKDALGWGDVKYLGAIGACFGLPGAFFSILFASLTGSLFGIFLILFKRKKMTAIIPFGPFLSISSIFWIFLDKKIIEMYFNFSNFLKTILR